MMKKYVFEVQNLIEVEVEAENAEDARAKLIDKLWNNEIDMTDAYVSDGREVSQ